MAVISAGDLTLLRSAPHVAQFYLSVHVPRTLWAARLNNASAARGDTSIPFDAGAGSYWSDVVGLQEVLVGTTLGGDEIGRLRIRNTSSGDAGVTGTLTAAEHNLILQDDAYLTFTHNYPLVPLFPKIESNGDFKKDRDIAYGSNYNDQPNPVPLAGDHRAGFIDDTLGYLQIDVDASNSYAIADSATISTYALSVAPSGGVTTSFDTGTGLGYIRFATAGNFWARFTVTDSNGVSQSTYRLYMVHERDRTGGNFPITSFSVGGLSGSWETGGWQADLSLHNEATFTTIPQRALAILWQEGATYGDTAKNVTLLPDESNSLLVGYTRRGSVSQNKADGTGGYNLTIETVNAVLDSYNFSLSLEAVASGVDKWYEYANWMTVGRIIHHLFKWHSTTVAVCDVVGLTDNTDFRAFGDIEDGTLYRMADGVAREAGIRAHLVADKGGRLHLTQDLQLLNDTERAALTVVQPITDADLSGSVSIIEQPVFNAAMSKVSGFYFDGTYDGTTGLPNVLPYCAIAPGTVPETHGQGIPTLERQVFRSQVHANEIAGRFHAFNNNPYPEFVVTFHGNYLGVLEVALGYVWTVDLQSADTVRGIVWTDKPLYAREVTASIDVTTGTITCNVTFEPEADGIDGVQTDCLGLPDLGGDDIVVPDPDDLPGALMTGSSVYYLPGQSKTWALRSSDDVSDLVADPFWAIKQASYASSAAIILRGGVGYVKYSDDAGSTWSDRTPGSVTNSAGDSPAPTVANLTFEHIASNALVSGEHVFLANWENSGGEARSWLYYTDDDGATWSHAAVSTSVRSPVFTKVDDEQITTDDMNGAGVIPLDSTYFMWWGTGDSAALKTLYVKVYSIDGSGNLTLEGTHAVGDSNSDWGDIQPVFGYDFVALSSTRVLCVYNNGGTFGALHGVTIDWDSGTSTISDNGGDVIDATTFVRGPCIVPVDASNAYVVWGRDPLSGNSEIKFADIAISAGGAITAGTVAVKETIGSGIIQDFCATIYDSQYALVTWYETSSTYYMQLFDHSLGSWIGTKEIVVVDDFPDYQIVNYSLGRVAGYQLGSAVSSTVAVRLHRWHDGTNFQLGLTAITRAVASLAAQTPVTVSSDSSAPSGGYMGMLGSEIVISGWGTLQANLSSASISGSTITWDNNITGVPIVNNRETARGVCYFSSSYVLPVALTSTGGTGALVTSIALSGFGSGGYDFDALGVEVDKGDGTTVWATGIKDEDTLTLMAYTLPGLANTDQIELGSANPTQVAARTYWAFPISDFLGNLWIFGRMNNPQGLGTAHIIKSDDAGATWTLFEGGWGTAHCGAMIVTTAGLTSAFQCTTSITKLYRGSTSLSFVVSLPFLSRINPHAVAYDYFDGTLYVAAGASQGTMIVKAEPPYSVWTDITYAHSGARPVVALELL